MWCQWYHQVKLFAGQNDWFNSVEGIESRFGQGHDNKYGQATIDQTPENSVGMMDRGFASKERIRQLQQKRSVFCFNNKQKLNFRNSRRQPFFIRGSQQCRNEDRISFSNQPTNRGSNK
ncbi:transposase [Geitlerinema sp. PCC 9228]|uniref:transposase n=1 Tax=Geitlerinema sp. PCC 9228 TaxID=111611 RepID=UPI001FCCDF8C